MTDLPERDLWETYMPAFKALVQQGDVREIMCAYQRNDGEPCCGNTRYLQQILRDEWGFRGLVTSDCGAVSDFWKPGYHGFSPTREDAAARAVIAGTDVECGSDYRSLPEAVKAGKIKEEQIDTSLKRLLKARFELGDFDSDDQVPWTKIPMSVVASPEHKQLALQAAREAVVLLQNRNNVLPLKRSQKIVVMGPNANDSTMLWGNYTGTPTSTVSYRVADSHATKSSRVSSTNCRHPTESQAYKPSTGTMKRSRAHPQPTTSVPHASFSTTGATRPSQPESTSSTSLPATSPSSVPARMPTSCSTSPVKTT